MVNIYVCPFKEHTAFYYSDVYMVLKDPCYEFTESNLHKFSNVRGASPFFFEGRGPTIFNFSESVLIHHEIHHDNTKDKRKESFTQFFFGKHFQLCFPEIHFPFFVRLGYQNIRGIDFQIVPFLSIRYINYCN